MRNKLAFMLTVVALTALAAAPAAFAAWQDTNICDVPSVDFPTIQSAIDEPLCFTVRLGVYTFTEQLTIRRSLTLGGQSFEHGDERFVSRLHPPAVMSDPALIRVVGPRSRVKIKHIVIEGPATGNNALVGVWAERDTRVTIRDCVFRDMRPPTLDTRWIFMGVHLGGPLMPKTKVGISGHLISNCHFDGYQNAAIHVVGEGTTATIEHSRLDANEGSGRPATAIGPVGVFAYDGAKVTVNRNNIVENSREGGGGAGVMLVGAAPNSVISFNNIDLNGTGVGVNGTSDAEVYRNGLSGNGAGIVLGWDSPADSNTISLNRIEGGRMGLHLGQAESNAISNNVIAGNSDSHGVFLSAETSANTLYRNRSEKNGAFGYLDASRGSETAGTANTYTSNICTGNNGGGDQASPAGVCRPE